MFFAGIDVGGTTVKLGVMDENGQIVFKGAVNSIVDNPEAMADRIAQALSDYAGKLAAAGISCAGRVNSQTNLVIAGNLKWVDVPFGKLVEERLGCPVAIDNDVAGALMAEWKFGACKGEKNVVYISFGTGVGGAFLIDGETFRGYNNTGGEIGHMITHAEGLPCACGGHGCYEKYAAATALIRMAGGLEPREIFRRAEAGDEEMNAVLDAYVHEIAIGLSGLICVFRPQLVVVGGGISNAGEPLLRRLRDHVFNKCPSIPNQEKPRVELAMMGNDAGMIGGCAMAMELVK